MKSFLRVSSLNTEWGGKGDFKFEGEIFASIRIFLFCLMQSLFIACWISLWKYMPQEIWVSKGMFFSNPCSVLFKSSKMTWLVDFEGRIGVGLSVFPGGDSMPTEWGPVSPCGQRTHSLPQLYRGPPSCWPGKHVFSCKGLILFLVSQCWWLWWCVVCMSQH